MTKCNPTSGERPRNGGAAFGGGERKAFVFYTNWYDDVVDSLTLEQQQEFLVLIVRYASHGEEPSERATPIVRSMFGLIRNVIDADLKKYDRICETNRKKAAASAEKRRTKRALKEGAPIVDNQALTPVEPIHNTQDSTPNTQNTSLNLSQSEAKAERNACGGEEADGYRPSWDEVAAYWTERRFRSSAQEFYRHYEERGWLNKKREIIRRWRIAANFWEDHYEKHVAPMLRREAEERRQALRADNERAAQQTRAQQMADRDAECQQRGARAVPPALAKHMYQRALMLTPNEDAAMVLLKRASEDENVRKRLVEGWRPSQTLP